jgi:hypothetical protein
MSMTSWTRRLLLHNAGALGTAAGFGLTSTAAQAASKGPREAAALWSKIAPFFTPPREP